MKLKYFICFFAIVFTVGFISCSTLKSDVIDIDGLKVAYIVKNGGLEDKSVGELGYVGLLKAEDELKIKTEILEGDINKPEIFEKEIKQVAERNELIIMNGTDLANLSVEVSAMFREKKIVTIGAKENETNIQDINFKDEEGGFLMGVIAGRNTTNNKIGFIALERNEDTERLLSGFIAGVKVVNNEAAQKLLDGEHIEYMTQDATEERLYEVGNKYIENGVDVIFEKLSVEEVGVFKAAKENGIKVIGVGTDKYEYYPEYKEIILSSMIKKIDEIVFNVIEETEKGAFRSGEQNSLMADLEGGKLDYSISTERTISKELFDEVKKYKEYIITGKIKVPTTNKEVSEFKG